MTMLARLASMTGKAAEPTYVDDVFSTYTYTGNGSTQTITNGIDLANKGGAIFIKARNIASAPVWYSTTRGTGWFADSSVSTPVSFSNFMTSFNNNGFTANVVAGGITNGSNNRYVSHSFEKAPKFFDTVSYIGDGASIYSRTIAHSLGIEPGMVFVVQDGGFIGWGSYCRLDDNYCTSGMQLNTNAANTLSVTKSAHLMVDSFRPPAGMNALGYTYTAFIFAHDPSANGIIQCGSYVGNGSISAGPVITLGWEPQFLIVKKASAIDGWVMADTMRGISTGLSDPIIYANSSAAENSGGGDFLNVFANGFYSSSSNGAVNGSGATYIYLAIRRPNKPPTLGTQVYNAIARTGTGYDATVTGVGFAPDLAIINTRSTSGAGAYFSDRLRGVGRYILSPLTNQEATEPANGGVNTFGVDGVSIGPDYQIYTNTLSRTYINHFFKRAPGVFDEVCYKGDGSFNPIAHNLEAQPELIFSKARTNTGNWATLVKISSSVWLTSNAVGGFVLNSTASTTQSVNYSSFLTASQYAPGYVGGGWESINSSGTDYVSYLFATKAGISKVGSYTGNGSSQTINAGFTTGARFVLIKRTDSTGDWYVWDSTRGIVAGNDPHLSLNTTAAEVTTDDSVDTNTSGFIVNQLAATNINVNAATYIFLSFS